MRRILTLLLFVTLTALSASAQMVQDASYRIVGHVKPDGTVQDASYRIIGRTKGVPMEWAALYFFFPDIL